MRVRIKETEPEWNPKKLEIIFDAKEEYEVFKCMVQTNESVPRVVFGFGGFCGKSREKEIKLIEIVSKLNSII